jgi:hypothetical protein
MGYGLVLSRKSFLVGINKVYFPKEMWPKDRFNDYFEVHEILAAGECEAAHLVWAVHGERWLSLLAPKTSKLPRIIRLHTSYPGGHWLGRLEPVKVYTE